MVIYWTAHKPVRFVRSYALSVTQQYKHRRTSAIHPTIMKNTEDLLMKCMLHISMRKSHNASMLNSFHNNITVRSASCCQTVMSWSTGYPDSGQALHLKPLGEEVGGRHSHCTVQLRTIMVGNLICLLCTPKPTGTNRLKQKTDNCITESGNILYLHLCLSLKKKRCYKS